MRAGRPRAGLRRRLLLVVLTTVVAAVALLTLGFNLTLRARLEADVNNLLRAGAAAQLSALDTVDGRLVVGEAPDRAGVESPVWIFAGRRALETPSRVSPSVDRAAVRLSSGQRAFGDVGEPPTRLLAVPVLDGGRRLGAVVVAVSERAYGRTERVVLVSSLALAAVLIVIVGLVARWLLTAALRPVARMTADAAEWSERDLEHRFGLGPPTDEITQLAATLDGLLGRVAGAVRREQRFSAELSHELRTPLAKISSRAQILRATPSLPPEARLEADAVLDSTVRMREVIDGLMSAARAEETGSRGSSDAVLATQAAVDAAVPLAEVQGITIALAGTGPLLVTAERTLVERMLGPVLDNACRMADTQAEITLNRTGAWIEIVVRDDGPGVAPGDLERIFEPGVRIAGAGGSHEGAGLGLALARRLARSAGGDIDAEGDGQGGRFLIRLPVA